MKKANEISKFFIFFQNSPLLRSVKALARHKLGEKSVLCDKFVIFAVLDYLAVVENDYPVALLYRGEAVRDDDAGAFECVMLSSALVASSNMSIFGFGATARAIISLCR